MRHIVFDFDGPIFDGRKAAETALEETAEHFAGHLGKPVVSLSGVPLYGPKRMISTLYTDCEVRDREKVQHLYEERLHAIEGISVPRFYTGIRILAEH